MSGMQSDYTGELLKELPKRKGDLGERNKLIVIKELTAIEKIDLLDAFKFLLDVNLKVKSTPEIIETINSMFKDWVKKSIDEIMTPSAHSFFTNDEISVLKTLVTTIVNKSKSNSSEIPNSSKKISPLKESLNIEKYQKEQENILSKLDKMEKEGPVF